MSYYTYIYVSFIYHIYYILIFNLLENAYDWILSEEISTLQTFHLISQWISYTIFQKTNVHAYKHGYYFDTYMSTNYNNDIIHEIFIPLATEIEIIFDESYEIDNNNELIFYSDVNAKFPLHQFKKNNLKNFIIPNTNRIYFYNDSTNYDSNKNKIIWKFSIKAKFHRENEYSTDEYHQDDNQIKITYFTKADIYKLLKTYNIDLRENNIFHDVVLKHKLPTYTDDEDNKKISIALLKMYIEFGDKYTQLFSLYSIANIANNPSCKVLLLNELTFEFLLRILKQSHLEFGTLLVLNNLLENESNR